MIPHTRPATIPEGIPETRFAAHLHAIPVGCQVALLGLADDTGVRMNNGRPGAAGGPAAFRAALARYGVASPHGWEYPRVYDAGDVQPAGTLEETHARVREAAGAILDLGLLPVAIGGGHDLTFPFVQAAAMRYGRLAGVYFDAHLDVRETAGSGMPFRRLIEDCGVGPLHLIGFNPLVNSREHAAWFLGHGGIFEEVSQGQTPRPLHHESSRAAQPELFVSFDLDCLDAAHAPGVSAVNPCGLSVRDVEPMVLAAGECDRVRCFDIMELNPAHDDGGRTARVAAHLFLTFLRGVARRSGREGADHLRGGEA